MAAPFPFFGIDWGGPIELAGSATAVDADPLLFAPADLRLDF